MTENINVTNFKSDFIKKKLTITSSTEPSTPDLRITSKIVPNFNLLLRIGFDIGFIEKGQIKVIKNEAEAILSNNDLEGLQDINTGTFLVSNGDTVDIKLWNTDGGTFDVIAMIFINSESDGTFVDPLALLEATSKTDTILDTTTNVSSSPITQDINMGGYKGIILSMGTDTGLPSGASIHDNTDGWTTPEAPLQRNSTAALKGGLVADQEIIYDMGQEVTGELVLVGRETATGSAHYEIEVSTDDISYSNVLTTGTLPSTFNSYLASSATFRYVKVIAVHESGTASMQLNQIGLKNYCGTEVQLKFQKSDDNGTTWTDFIVSTEYDTELDSTDADAESFTITRDNPSNTSVIYVFPQGSNKLRIHITLTLYTSWVDSASALGYSGKISIEKIN